MRRLITLDAMRGIAAISVVFCNISAEAFEYCNEPFIRFLYSLFHFGSLGIAVFFAISGFVIAASLSNQDVTFTHACKFLTKRSVRINLIYLVSIALDIALSAAVLKMLTSHVFAPNIDPNMLHLLYAQDLARAGNVAAIYWALCLNYLVFCFCVAMGKYLSTSGMLAGVTLFSMFVSTQLLPIPIMGLFVIYWLFFVIGAAAYYWGVKACRNHWAFPALLTGMLIVAVFQTRAIGIECALNLIIACAAATLFYVGAREKKLSTWLDSRALLYLGSRSYSIYLFHAIVGERVVKVLVVIAERFSIPVDGQAWSLFMLAAGIAASLLVAEIAFRLIEKPSILLSRRLVPEDKLTDAPIVT